jgi:hypothetical protein
VGLAQEVSSLPQSTGASADMRATPGAVLAQEVMPMPLPGSPESGVGGGILETLPRPPDTPKSLFAQEQPPSMGGINIQEPYFLADPLLDPSFFPAPGWFAGAEVQIVKPHLTNGYANSVFPGKAINDTTGIIPKGGNSTLVNLPPGPLDWTASPRVFAGYRLPSGFGEFMVAYRHLGTTGSSSVPDTNGPIGLYSRFAFDILDIDYNSRELSLWPRADMKWTLGLRNLFLYSSTQGSQPFGQASGSNGILLARESNNLYGIGPHAALELNHHLGDSGLSLYSRLDAGAVFSYVNEDWLTVSTMLGANGRPLPGQTQAFGHQFIPMINWRAGVSWHPAATSGSRVFVGYQYEVFWDLDRLPQSNGTPFAPPSLGQYQSQGIVLQATFNW